MEEIKPLMSLVQEYNLQEHCFIFKPNGKETLGLLI